MKKLLAKYISLILALLVSMSSTALAESKIGVEKDVRGYLIGTYENGEILENYGRYEPRPIASLSKIMVAYLLFDELEKGNINLDDVAVISKEPSKKLGSKLGLEEGDQVLIEDLLKGILIPSANDGCVAIGEYLYGSEQALVQKMNEKAEYLGLKHTHYYNATGLTEGDKVNLMTMEDLFELVRSIIKNHSEILSYSQMKSMEFKNQVFENTNPLLKTREDIIGLKTGATARAGSCLIAVKKLNSDENVVIAIIMGTFSKWKRAEVSENIFKWLDSNYNEKEIILKNKALDIDLGDDLFSKSTRVYPVKDYLVYAKNDSRFEVRKHIDRQAIDDKKRYYKKKVGSLEVYRDGELMASVDLEFRASDAFSNIMRKLFSVRSNDQMTKF